MDIFKDPVTDHGKLSKKGRMTLEKDENGVFVTRTEGLGDPEKVGDRVRTYLLKSKLRFKSQVFLLCV